MDSSWAIFRAVIFEYSKVSEEVVEESSTGLDKWFQVDHSKTSVVDVKHTVYRVSKIGFLVQNLGSKYARIVWASNFVLKAAKPNYRVCRYHEDIDYGENIEYCSKLTRSLRGYCSIHINTPRALYEMCAQGIDDACRKASRYFVEEKFTVYLLDYGGSRVKIGLTKSSRFLWRISEQPHIATTQVFVGDLISSRVREKELGRHKLATEGPGARLEKRTRLAIRILEQKDSSASFFGKRIARFISMLGLSGSFRSYTVLPRSISSFKNTREININQLLGRRLAVEDYWGGSIVFRDRETRELLLINKNSLLHYPVRVIFE